MSVLTFVSRTSYIFKTRFCQKVPFGRVLEQVYLFTKGRYSGKREIY